MKHPEQGKTGPALANTGEPVEIVAWHKAGIPYARTADGRRFHATELFETSPGSMLMAAIHWMYQRDNGSADK